MGHKESNQKQQEYLFSNKAYVIKLFMLNSNEHEISTAHKNLNADEWIRTLLLFSQMLYLSC